MKIETRKATGNDGALAKPLCVCELGQVRRLTVGDEQWLVAALDEVFAEAAGEKFHHAAAAMGAEGDEVEVLLLR